MENQVGKTYKRPWGEYKVLEIESNLQVKLIKVKPQSAISLQFHKHREEYWVFVSGEGELSLGDNKSIVKHGSHVKIKKLQIHRILNLSDKEDLVFVETQSGSYLGEDDIIRIEDDYGRS